jgi:hypothetical protein
MSSGRNQGAPISPQTTRPPVGLSDIHTGKSGSDAITDMPVTKEHLYTAQMFQTLLPSMSPNRVDLPTVSLIDWNLQLEY